MRLAASHRYGNGPLAPTWRWKAPPGIGDPSQWAFATYGQTTESIYPAGSVFLGIPDHGLQITFHPLLWNYATRIEGVPYRVQGFKLQPLLKEPPR